METDSLLSYLRETYDYKEGFLLFKRRVNNRISVGQKAGCIGQNGYWYMNVCNRTRPVHRMVFLHQHGYLPKVVDHINHNRCDNRIENLRGCDQRLNMLNRKGPNSNNKLGILGVSKHRDKFVAQTPKVRKLFDTPQEASIFYKNTIDDIIESILND